MVYASIERSPTVGGSVRSYTDNESLLVMGVQRTMLIEPPKPPYGFQLLGGVAVIADNTWAAFRGREKLHIEWEPGPNAAYNSSTFKKTLQETVRQSCKIVRNEGDINAEFAKGGKTFEGEYYVPHLAHAAMEPLAALVDVRGNKVTAWAAHAESSGSTANHCRSIGN